MTAGRPGTRQRGGLLLPLAILVAMIGLALAAGLLGYRHELAQYRSEKGHMLTAIADLKVRQISAWLDERRSDAELALHDEQLAAQADDWLLRGAPDDDAGHNLKAHLQSILLASQYHSVILLDSDLQIRAAAGTTLPFDDTLRRAARDAMQRASVTFVDNRADNGGGQFNEAFTLFVPLRDGTADPARTVGLLALSIDPNRYLYPQLEWWPTPASSGATYLIRHQGEQLTYMYDPHNARNQGLSIPTRFDKQLSAQALNHKTTLLEGIDYRQRQVLAGVRSIPDTDWLLVAKLDWAEIEQAARNAARDIMLLSAAFLALIGSLVWTLWHRSHSRYRLAEMERQLLTRQLDYLSKYANDVILLMDDKGRLIDANDKALEVYGYSREELLKQPFAALHTAEALLDYPAQWQQDELQHGLVFETVHQHRNGSTFPVEVSARLISVEGKRFRQAIIRDISERKKADEDIVKARDFYLSLMEIFPHPVWRAGIDAKCDYFNNAWLEFRGREPEQELGNGWTEGVHPDDLDACMNTYLDAFKDRRPFIMEYRLRHHDGSYHWITDHGKPFFDMNGTFAGYIGSCYDIQQIKTAEERMEFLANHDSLTRLPNRMLLHDRIDHALAGARRDGRQVAVLFIDLDRFKDINDTLGHAIGDQLLRAFADRLHSCVRDADTVSRLGGDEFVVVIPELREIADAAPVAQKILDAMMDDFSIENHNLRVSPSIGISAYPHDGQDAETLIRCADSAMYAAKQSGRSATQFHSPALYISAHERLNMEYGLRHALARDEFVLHYQPQFDARTHALVGLEALLRWDHPGKGLLLPAQFLPIAEAGSVMAAIGHWVLKTACAQCRAWQVGGLSVPVCVNLSPVQLQQPELLTEITTALRDSGLPAELLHISITEKMLQQSGSEAQESLRALHALGIGVTIDDFDASHAPPEQFRQRTIDTFMLHHRYVRNIARSGDAAAVTRAIIDMAHQEQLTVIAEGVETQDQLEMLSAQGCDAVQGFYFSKALPPEGLEEILKNRTVFGASDSRH